ncbi:MAG: hypothetical protein K2I19_01370 [Muribaculaceae bacterium]|nr:hypothetical protein [Muribaculaceae bacterium]
MNSNKICRLKKKMIILHRPKRNTAYKQLLTLRAGAHVALKITENQISRSGSFEPDDNTPPPGGVVQGTG